jgi:serine/threonine protein kinase
VPSRECPPFDERAKSVIAYQRLVSPRYNLPNSKLVSLTPGARLGVYEIVGLLGAGGMGEVYRARDSRLNRDVAIKVLSADFTAGPERIRRLQQEARAAAALNHPNICALPPYGVNTPVLVAVSAAWSRRPALLRAGRAVQPQSVRRDPRAEAQ